MDTSNVPASFSSFVYKESVVERKKVPSAANQKAWVNGGTFYEFGALLIPYYGNHVFLYHPVFVNTVFSLFGAFGWCRGS